MNAANTTPLRKQYLDIKRRHPDAILLFRIGDFYEAFDDDARLIARELDAPTTASNTCVCLRLWPPRRRRPKSGRAR